MVCWPFQINVMAGEALQQPGSPLNRLGHLSNPNKTRWHRFSVRSKKFGGDLRVDLSHPERVEPLEYTAEESTVLATID